MAERQRGREAESQRQRAGAGLEELGLAVLAAVLRVILLAWPQSGTVTVTENDSNDSRITV